MKRSFICLSVVAMLIGLQPMLAKADDRKRFRPIPAPPPRIASPSLTDPRVRYDSLYTPSSRHRSHGDQFRGHPSVGGQTYGSPSFGGTAYGHPSLGGPAYGSPSFGGPSYGVPHSRYEPDGVEIQIREWYFKYLGREPEPAALGSWIDYVYRGATLAEAQIGIMSSPECFERCRNDPGTYVQFLIGQITGREATPYEVQTWVELFHNRFQGERRDFSRALINSITPRW